jgi:hypothetical protein
MSKISDHLHAKIEGLKASYMLLQGLSADEAEARAVSEVKQQEATNKPKPKARPATSTAPSPPVDAQTKIDADFVRNALLRDFDIDVIEDLADMSDDDLRKAAEDSGIA